MPKVLSFLFIHVRQITISFQVHRNTEIEEIRIQKWITERERERERERDRERPAADLGFRQEWEQASNRPHLILNPSLFYRPRRVSRSCDAKSSSQFPPISLESAN